MRGSPRAGARPFIPAALLCLLVAASGCYAVPPPLMYPATPVPAGHFGLGGAAVGSFMPSWREPSHLYVSPGLQLSGRYGLGRRVSVGLRIFGGPGAMVDGRFEVLHTPRLSLSLGLTLGAVAAQRRCIAPPGAICTEGVLSEGTELVGLGSVPVVLGWRVGRTTIQLGLRPGARLPEDSRAYLVGTTTPLDRLVSAEPLAGVLLGVSTPLKGIGAFDLEVDVTRSFVNPGTVVAVALGVSH